MATYNQYTCSVEHDLDQQQSFHSTKNIQDQQQNATLDKYMYSQEYIPAQGRYPMQRTSLSSYTPTYPGVLPLQNPITTVSDN